MISSRVIADERARETISRLQERLVAALGGETLRGLPDLGGKIFGLRLDVEGSVYARLHPGRPTPILEAKGYVVLASVHGKAGFLQAMPPTMIRASLLEPYIRAVGRAASLYIEGVGTRSASFERMSELSERVRTAIL